MKRSQFTEEHVVASAKEGEAGREVADMRRANRVSAKTFYNWKAKHGGLELRVVQGLRQIWTRIAG
jgi:putative transposase